MGIDVHIYVKGNYVVNPRKKWNFDMDTQEKYYGYFGEGYGSSPLASEVMFEEAFNEDIIYKKTGYGHFSHKKKYLFHWKPEVLLARLDKAIEACEERGTPWRIRELKNFVNTYCLLDKKGHKPWISVSY